MPLPLLNHSALALFAQRTRIPTSARSICFCFCELELGLIQTRMTQKHVLLVEAHAHATCAGRHRR